MAFFTLHEKKMISKNYGLTYGIIYKNDGNRNSMQHETYEELMLKWKRYSNNKDYNFKFQYYVIRVGYHWYKINANHLEALIKSNHSVLVSLYNYED